MEAHTLNIQNISRPELILEAEELLISSLTTKNEALRSLNSSKQILAIYMAGSRVFGTATPTSDYVRLTDSIFQ